MSTNRLRKNIQETNDNMNNTGSDNTTVVTVFTMIVIVTVAKFLVDIWQKSMDRKFAKIQEESNARFEAAMAPIQALHDSPGQKRERLIAQVEQWHREGKTYRTQRRSSVPKSH